MPLQEELLSGPPSNGLKRQKNSSHLFPSRAFRRKRHRPLYSLLSGFFAMQIGGAIENWQSSLGIDLQVAITITVVPPFRNMVRRFDPSGPPVTHS